MKVLIVVLYKDGEEQLDRSCETGHTTQSQGGKECPTLNNQRNAK